METSGLGACQAGAAGVPGACSCEGCASSRGQMLPPKPSINDGICSSPRLVHLPPGHEAHRPTQTLLSAPPPPHAFPWGSQIVVFPRACVASCCGAHSLAASGSDWNLIGSLKNPDCLIIIRQRNYQGIKGCSQLLY